MSPCLLRDAEAGLLLHQPKGLLMPPKGELGVQAHLTFSRSRLLWSHPAVLGTLGRAPPSQDICALAPGWAQMQGELVTGIPVTPSLKRDKKLIGEAQLRLSSSEPGAPRPRAHLFLF